MGLIDMSPSLGIQRKRRGLTMATQRVKGKRDPAPVPLAPTSRHPCYSSLYTAQLFLIIAFLPSFQLHLAQVYLALYNRQVLSNTTCEDSFYTANCVVKCVLPLWGFAF